MCYRKRVWLRLRAWIAARWSGHMKRRNSISSKGYGSGVWIRGVDRLCVRGMDEDLTFRAAAICIYIYIYIYIYIWIYIYIYPYIYTCIISLYYIILYYIILYYIILYYIIYIYHYIIYIYISLYNIYIYIIIIYIYISLYNIYIYHYNIYISLYKCILYDTYYVFYISYFETPVRLEIQRATPASHPACRKAATPARHPGHHLEASQWQLVGQNLSVFPIASWIPWKAASYDANDLNSSIFPMMSIHISMGISGS